MNVSENIIETDVLIIGGGTAGCFAAIKAREQGLDVTIVDKAYAGKSGASIAAAGWWAVFNPEWGHTLDAAMNFGNAMLDYLLNREWNEIVYKESWQTFQDIIAWGVEFPTTLDQLKDYHNKQLIRGRTNEDGHFAPFDDPNTPFTLVPLRHRKTTPYLRKQAHKVGVRIIDRIVVTDLLKKDGKVIGAVGFPTDSYDLYIFKAKATVLSAGGSSYKPPGHWINSVTGDAEGMAYRAGAELGGKEFPDGHMTQGPYPGWKSGEMYPVYYYYTDAEGKEITKAYGTVANPFTIHEGKGPVYHDFDAATAKDLEALQEYIRKRGNPIELPRAGIDPGRGGKFHMMGALPQDTR